MIANDPQESVDRQGLLVQAARAGDREAFATLLRPHFIALRGKIRAATRHRPEVDPEDVLQETLIRSFEALDLLDQRYTFGQYVFGIAKYAVLRHVAGTRREVAVAWEEELDEPAVGVFTLPRAEDLPTGFHAIVGVGRFPSPDERTRSRVRLREMLTAMFAYGGYPHQQMAFAWSVALWGKPKAEAPASPPTATSRRRKAPVTGDPDRVVRELSALSLEEAGRGFRAEIEGREHLDAWDLDEAFRPFNFRLGLVGRQLFACDPASRLQFPDLAGSVIATTCMSEYYGQDPRRSVSDWSDSVKTRVRKYLTGESDMRHSPLPMP